MSRWSRRARGLWTAACLLTWLGLAAIPAGGDVRTSATAPGLVGDPLFAVAGVVLIGLIAVGATLLYVRLTRQR